MRIVLGGAVAAVVLAAALQAGAALRIERVVPMASDRDVKVRVEVQSDDPGAGEIRVEGEIVPADGGQPLWKGDVGEVKAGTAEKRVEGLKPKTWSPGSPVLYRLVVTAKQGGQSATESVRFGFRSIEAREGKIWLNGHPIFLKGIAINPPDRDIPDEVGYSREFAIAYVRYLRSQHVNLIRMTFPFQADERQQVWFDACDELGMMVDQGQYGAPPLSGKGRAVDPDEQAAEFQGRGREAGGRGAARTSKSAAPADFEASMRAYKEVFETYARHPSVIIYVLSNELPGPNGSNAEWHEYLQRAAGEIHAWDPTRLIIGNAGYGLGREGDLCDVHRYWGWYYNSFLTYYSLRDTVGMFGQSTANQPFTFSECVGSFTSPLGSFNAVFRKQLAPQLGWTGHSPTQAEDALEYQSFMVKHAAESFRTMREQNPRLAGLMPFTILFYNWEGIHSFEEMKPKPAMEQLGRSYQPVLPSIELWTSQVYAGSTIRPIVHVVNDAEDFADLAGATLRVEVVGEGGKVEAGKVMDLPKIVYYESRPVPVEIELPRGMATGDYAVRARVEREGKVVGESAECIYVEAARPVEPAKAGGPTVAVYDPHGQTLRALRALGVKVEQVKDLSLAPETRALIIGQETLSAGTRLDALKAYVQGGGRVLVLAQEAMDTSWLPVAVQMLAGTATDPTYPVRVRPTADQQNVNPERPWHPVFTGVSRARLRLWSDYTGWDQSKNGFPKVFPVTHGFKLARPEDLARTAILADYEHGLEGVALAEFFDGRGSVILTGLDLTTRCGLDPVADRMLANLAAYLTASSAEHETQPLIDRPIEWGDFASERGVLTGPMQGLVYNCRWVPPPGAVDAKSMADNTGAWNTHPGNPFVPRGVRPFGPYTWSAGASPREESKSKTGTGFFCCRVPSGRTAVLTKVQNVQKEDARLVVSVNGDPGEAASVPAGQTITIRTRIPGDATDLTVRYTGDKQLVILETAFE